LVVVPAGNFMMGAKQEHERPVRRVQIDKAFAIGRYEITFSEWMKCNDEGPCNHQPSDRGWGRGNRPVINISWVDAKAYATWLSQKTGQTYRLPSEAEWEYAARARERQPRIRGGRSSITTTATSAVQGRGSEERRRAATSGTIERRRWRRSRPMRSACTTCTAMSSSG
jgi:formylglycine-generating enzyme required for sulfatase activity